MSETEDHRRLIRDSAGGIAPRDGDLRAIRALRFSAPGFDRAVWRAMVELGWPALMLPEAVGGCGLGMAEFAVLLEECGAALRPEPLLAVALALACLPDKSAAIASGRIVVPAFAEAPDAIFDPPATIFAHGRLAGAKHFVEAANAADAFIVSTTTGLVLVARDAPGLSIALHPTQDGNAWGSLTFDDAPAIALAGDTAAALDLGALGTAAYLLGVTDRAFAITLAYLKTRVQFGKPIGAFQALQHRMADYKIQIELLRASVDAAARLWDSDADPADKRAAIARAKSRAAEASLLITRNAVQLHGGIGFTDEADIGLFLRKAMTLANAYGSAATHRTRAAA